VHVFAFIYSSTRDRLTNRMGAAVILKSALGPCVCVCVRVSLGLVQVHDAVHDLHRRVPAEEGHLVQQLLGGRAGRLGGILWSFGSLQNFLRFSVLICWWTARVSTSSFIWGRGAVRCSMYLKRVKAAHKFMNMNKSHENTKITCPSVSQYGLTSCLWGPSTSVPMKRLSLFIQQEGDLHKNVKKRH